MAEPDTLDSQSEQHANTVEIVPDVAELDTGACLRDTICHPFHLRCIEEQNLLPELNR